MLRLAQPQQKSDNRSDNTPAPRSLEALLAVNTATSAGDTAAAADTNGRRCSVSSDWSPPPSPSTGAALSRVNSSRQPMNDGGGAGVGTAVRGVCVAGTARIDLSSAGATATGTGVDTSAWGSDANSNPPTPARMGFEGQEPSTPGGKMPAEKTPGSGDR